jgi:ribosomal protein S18 acetylase RimI-like enzyme
MKITTFTLPNIIPHRQKIALFLKKNGEGKITHRALRWLSNISSSSDAPGSMALVALEEKKLAGVMIFSHYGIEEAITAVHPQFRKQGVGEALLLEAKKRLGKVYTKVACDNEPSLKLCFRCGLTAFHLFKGPTGKPTLWLGGGNYDPKDIL